MLWIKALALGLRTNFLLLICDLKFSYHFTILILILYRYRNPNAGDDGQSSLTLWPEYDTTTLSYIRFKGGLDAFPIESHYVADRMNFWLDFVPVIYGRCDVDVCCEDNIVQSGSSREGLTSERSSQLLHMVLLFASSLQLSRI